MIELSQDQHKSHDLTSPSCHTESAAVPKVSLPSFWLMRFVGIWAWCPKTTHEFSKWGNIQKHRREISAFAKSQLDEFPQSLDLASVQTFTLATLLLVTCVQNEGVLAVIDLGKFKHAISKLIQYSCTILCSPLALCRCANQTSFHHLPTFHILWPVCQPSANETWR